MKTIATIMRKTGMKFKGFMFFYLIISFIVAVAMLFTNIFEGYLAETALASDMTAMRNFLLLITGTIAVRAIFAGMQTFFRRRQVAKAEYSLRNYFIDHFLRAPFSKVEATGSGEVLSVYSNDIENTAMLVVSNIAFAIEGLALFATALTFLITTSTLFSGEGGLSIWRLLLMFAGMIGLVILIMQPMQRFQKQASEERARYNEIVNDSLQNLSVIAAYSLEEVIEDR
jgi:subfamily B ATP-binding cassette protein MsbA